MGGPKKRFGGIIKKYSVNPHPAYRLGWGRVSCIHCIFASSNQCASAAKVDPDGSAMIELYEEDFGLTIDRKKSLKDRIAEGEAYQMDAAIIAEAMSTTWAGPVIVENWELPAGAFGESCGPV